MVMNPIVKVYIPIIRTIPNMASFDLADKTDNELGFTDSSMLDIVCEGGPLNGHFSLSTAPPLHCLSLSLMLVDPFKVGFFFLVIRTYQFTDGRSFPANF